MICYLDASALVKRYVAEPGSEQVARLFREAEALGTVILTRTEVMSSLAKGVRMGLLAEQDAQSARQQFTAEWPHLMRLQVTELIAEQAGSLAWQHGLRAYDALQLAAAQTWQQALGLPVLMVVFDRHLWRAAERSGLVPYPDDLPTLLDSWRAGEF